MQITHCPQCETAFKVSPEQLELAKGWVRCGRCAHIFEAVLHLQDSFDASVSTLTSTDVLHNAVPPTVVMTEVRSTDRVERVKNTKLSWSWVWPVSAACLCLALLMQILLAQRNWLAAQIPVLRPWLSAICICEIGWPRESDAVLIESSSFTASPDGGYTVHLRLKNTQPYTVAMPALELSLTDLQDQVLVRRVFTAEQLLDQDHVQAFRDVPATLVFDLNDKVSERITGFRVSLFYP